MVVAEMKKQRQCKDCPSGSKRKANHPGPRCATHYRAISKLRKAHAHERHVQNTYGLKSGEYTNLYQKQGCCCAICRRATGKSKRLAVDHNHKTGLVRGLLCGPCNKMLALARSNPAFFTRAARYLKHPPAQL